MQLPVQLDVTAVIWKVYVTRLDAREDIFMQQDISVSVSFYSTALFSITYGVIICRHEQTQELFDKR